MFDFIKVDAATYVDGITCKIKWTIIFDMNYLVSICKNIWEGVISDR